MAKIDNGVAAAAQHGVGARSPKWPAAEKLALKTQHYCDVCGLAMDPKVKLQVHHVIPYHFCVLLGRPDLELDQRNLIVLCETEEGAPAPNHHLLVGHSGDFQSSNINVRKDAPVFFRMDEATIKKNPHYLENIKGRLKPWDQMNDDDKKSLRALMDSLYPLL
jgi:hypothetical protein